MKFGEDTFNVMGLDKLLKALHAKPPVTRVGILGSSTHYAQLKAGQSMPKHVPTNAEVGAAHEFGTTTIKQRSFLRMPVTDGLQKEMESSGLFDYDVIRDVLKEGTVKPWMNKVAICAEACIADAFDTGGNGKWPAWKNSNYSNNAGQLLVDTQQLRNSITSEVK